MDDYKYYKFEGRVKAFQKDGSEDDYIPDGAVEMSPSEVDAHINPKPTKEAIKVRLNSEFEAAMAALHRGWPDYEVQTWTVQADEARHWTAAPEDSKPVTPFLSSLHTQREAMGWVGTLADLVERVIENTNAYTAATASLIGRRHVAERAIDAAGDPTSVSWDFSLANSTAELS